MGGNIAVENQPGAGSTCTVSITLERAQGPVVADTDEPTPAVTPLRILLAGRQRGEPRGCAALLGRHGNSVSVVIDGRQL